MARYSTRRLRRWNGRGGFYPSVMGKLMISGPYFMTAAFAQGSRLIQNNRERMAKRKPGASRRITKRRKPRAL